MNRKKVLIIVIISILILLGISIFIIFSKRVDREYEIITEKEYNYWLLKQDDRYGVINKYGDIILEPEYDQIDIPNRDKAIFVTYKDENKKVLNHKSEEIFEGKDISAIEIVDYNEEDDENLCDTSRLKYFENNKYGMIDLDGNKITDPIYDEIISLPGKYGEYRVSKEEKYGVISNKGVELVKCKYDSIEGDGYIDNNNSKNAGYIVGKKTDNGIMYGYIDVKEKEIIKLENEKITRVTNLKNNELYLVITKNGRNAIYKDNKNKTDYIYREINYSEEGDIFIVKKNKKYGVIGKDLKELLSPEYDELFVSGMYINATKDKNISVFELNGKKIENTEYIGLSKTSTDKFYIVMNEEYKYGILDMQRKQVFPCENDYIKEVEGTDLISVTNENDITIYSASLQKLFSIENARMDIVNNYIRIVSDDEVNYFTLDGKKVDNKSVYLKNEIYADSKNGKWGFVDLDGNVIVKYKYDKVTEINEYGFAGIKKNGKWGVINKEGKVILKPTYESDAEDPIFIGKYCLNGKICSDEIY